MRNKILIVGLFVVAMITGWGWTIPYSAVHAQAITSATPYSFQTTGTQANCPAVAASTTQYCFTTTGLYQSLSGSAWTLVGATAVGVTSLTVCGASGANCGTAQTGAVTLDVPKTVTVTSSGTLQ